jgi:hypothetical protein
LLFTAAKSDESKLDFKTPKTQSKITPETPKPVGLTLL